ncbi:hypothetical protein [Mucilaginibacter sp.]|uniref:hypothetical protein n=1 Tax=Mucilaginibacter sp. TaxID=1882438 RepID=UPI002639347A|nr:hypothetical protein [Mucilaginibacter sp.]
MKIATIKRGNKILAGAIGRSAADAEHIAAEFCGCLLRNVSPYGELHRSWESVYRDINEREQSGFSNAIKMARGLNCSTLELTDNDGDVFKDLCDQAQIISSDKTARIQEGHILIGRNLGKAVDDPY